jgi:hypothetical protein
MASINVDGLVYGEAMIRALEIDVRDLRAALKLAEEERDTWRGKYEHCLETLHANDRQTVLAQRHLTTERDAAVRERDGLHTSLKAVADLCIDKAGLRAMEVVGEDSPPRAVAKIIEQRDAAIARAEQAERERDAANRECVGIVNAVIGAPQNTAVIAVVEHAIASWLDERSKHHGYLHDKAADQDARDEHGWAARAADEGEG